MANLNDLFQLDPLSATNASNSNYAGANIQEGCAPSTINNALRALGSIVSRALNYQSAALSASVSTNIAAASTGIYMPIVGAGAINSFGVVPGEHPDAAVIRILEFSSSASLSHGSTLILIGGASRKTQPGDVGGYIHEGSADQWREFLYSRADGSLLNSSIANFTAGSLSASIGRFNMVAAQSASVSTANLTSISASVGAFGILTVAGSNVAGPVYIIADQKASGTDGGGITSGAFRTRTLNTEILDQIGITTTTNAMAVPAGVYIARFNTTCFAVDNFMARLQDTTNTVTRVVGNNADAPAATHGWSTGYGSFSLSNTSNLELQVRVTTTNGTDGGGQAHSFGTEQYSIVYLEKIA